MKKLFLPVILLFSILCTNAQEDYTQFVNPFVGTDFTGHTYPGAILPFGAIQASPDTRLDGWQGCSAYHYSDSIVYGFSHTHLSGTGCSDYGDVLLMPFAGAPSVINTEYASTFSHSREQAEPGYYSVILDKNNIKAELTVSKRVAMHRYTFGKSNHPKGIILDLKHRDIVLQSVIKYDESKKAIIGMRDSRAWNPEQKLDFSILFSQPIKKIEYYIDDMLIDSVPGITGKNCKAIIYFYPEITEVVLKVAISGVGTNMEDAYHNQIEIADFNFDQVRNEARQIWNNELHKIEVETSDIELKKIFYTALYHCFTSPYLFSDVNGMYRGMDGKIHKSVNHDVYTVFSLWDTYRALHPLLALIDRKRTGDFIYSFTKHYEQGGVLPMWELSAYETWCMIGYHSVSVIYDAFIKGIIDYNPQLMLDAMVQSAKLNKLGRPEFAQYGFIPANLEHESVSKTLEYAYDDWCIAQFAKALGNTQIYQEFIHRCQYYKNIIDSQGFMHPRINGAFIDPFDPTEVNNHYTEANSWQYSTYIPHDFNGYINLMGGTEFVNRFLDSLFNTSNALSGRNQVDVTGLIGQYAHGNEPSHHASYLYNYVHQPWKTQNMTRKIMSELYTSKPDGLCGNEDCGQMSAWYIFSAMGFYPVCPGDNKYCIGSPIFDKVTIHLENGKNIIIKATNQNKENVYIKSCKLNGKKYTKTFITYDNFKNGALLEFIMSPKPNYKWATKDADFPQNFVEPTLTQTPIFNTTQRSFKSNMMVTLTGFMPSGTINGTLSFPKNTNRIFYTTDGSQPTINSNEYKQPILISENTTLKAVAWNKSTGYSNVVEADYIKFMRDKSIQLITPYNPQYPADGPDALIDNIRGTLNFKLGGWQGFDGVDFQAVIDLESNKTISEVSAGFLQEIRSWIWFPTEFQVEVSTDKTNWSSYGVYKNKYPVDNYNSIILDFTVKGNATARYVRITAKSFGKIPEWHLGAGYNSWIFMDEIIIK